jgi:hypothetical protein
MTEQPRTCRQRSVEFRITQDSKIQWGCRVLSISGGAEHGILYERPTRTLYFVTATELTGMSRLGWWNLPDMTSVFEDC